VFGHNGKLLRVNLSTNEITEEHYSEEFARKFLGGNGFAAKMIYDGVAPDTDPFDEDNAVVFTVGPLTDTPVWGTSRGHVGSISPQTGFFADSNFGGSFAVAQKRSGFDAIYITGESTRPVYLLVTENGGELKDADDIWGRTTDQARRILEAKEGKDALSACIGPAGENMVIFANIVCAGGRHGVAGRCGLGAVMGSKRLKAVVVRGDRRTEIARPDKLKELLKEQLETLRSNTAVLTEYGTPFLVDMVNERGLLCTHNAAIETCEFARHVNAEVLKAQYIVGNTACFGCPVACGKKVESAKGLYANQAVKMPEYETIYALGTMLDNDDMVSIIDGNTLCDSYGMDTVSMGVTLSFLAECLEKGIVSESELGGRVNFGDGAQMVELIKATVAKQGIGRLLALGSKRLADKFGPEAQRFLYCAKGLEIPGHSARGLRPLTLGYATGTRGGTHHDTRPKYTVPDEDPGFAGQGEYNVQSQNATAVGDSLVICRFTGERGLGSMLNQTQANVLGYVTGWDVDVEELEAIGERIYNLERLINVRRGMTRADDTLPLRTMTEPIPYGPAKGRYCSRKDLDTMLDEYYRLRGWTEDGIPTDEKLAELGLL